jgi:hypothetical protein
MQCFGVFIIVGVLSGVDGNQKKLGGNTMKKFIAPILSLSLVFATALSASAAPIVSGEVDYTLDIYNTSNLEATINFDGKLSNAIDYKVSLDKDSTFTDTAISVDEASLTYSNKVGQVQIGQFAYNPTVMDMMDTKADGGNLVEMKDTFAVKVTPNLGENLHFALGFQPNDDETFESEGFQAELDYKFSKVTVGVNYQNLHDGNEAGLVWQVEAQPIESLKIYGEYGNQVGTENDQALIGAAFNQNKFGVRGEYNMDSEAWAAKVNYDMTKNISAEFQTNSEEEQQVQLSYTF